MFVFFTIECGARVILLLTNDLTFDDVWNAQISRNTQIPRVLSTLENQQLW